MKMLQTDLDAAREELRNVRGKNEAQEASRFQMEITLRNQENEVRELRSQLTNLQTNNQV
jgi:hypothetical protein